MTAGATDTVGFVGLGNMGGALASNLVQAGHTVLAYDAAGPQRTPEGASCASTLREVVRQARWVVLSLPDGHVSEQVAREIVAVDGRRASVVVDTSTVGVGPARGIETLLADAGVGYVDAPVSGGVAGARARTLTVMYAGQDAACAEIESVLAGLSDRRFRVGNRPGMAQAMKLANNFLSATALAATSEAVAFGQAVGLDLATMLEVWAASSGRNAAITDKFPDHVLTGRYASGFANSLMAKDVALYLSAVEDTRGPVAMGAVTADIWQRFSDASPGVDFTRIFPFVAASSVAAIAGPQESS